MQVNRGLYGIYILPTPKTDGWMILDTKRQYHSAPISKGFRFHEINSGNRCRTCKKRIPPGIELLLKMENMKYVK